MALSTTPVSSIGATLASKWGSSTTFSAYVQLMDDCDFGDPEVGVIEIKPLGSNVVTRAPGRIDYKSFGGSLYNVPADTGCQQMVTLFNARTTVMWQFQMADDPLTLSTGTTYTFSGFISKLSPGNFTGEDVPSLTFEIAISGLVTETAGS